MQGFRTACSTCACTQHAQSPWQCVLTSILRTLDSWTAAVGELSSDFMCSASALRTREVFSTVCMTAVWVLSISSFKKQEDVEPWSCWFWHYSPPESLQRSGCGLPWMCPDLGFPGSSVQTLCEPSHCWQGTLPSPPGMRGKHGALVPPLLPDSQSLLSWPQANGSHS